MKSIKFICDCAIGILFLIMATKACFFDNDKVLTLLWFILYYVHFIGLKIESIMGRLK